MRSLLVILGLMVCAASALGSFNGHTLSIGNADPGSGQTAPYFEAVMDAGGYSDGIYYGGSPLHEHFYHELLSGEWGAAIYYSGINTDPTADPNDSPDEREAMWLTRHFDYPDWPTNSDFWKAEDKICEEWYDENNPTPLLNTGQSTIRNNEVEITIDYEVVDLEGLGTTYSAMAFLPDPNSQWRHMYSDRYVFLQTYTIKNIDPNGEPLTNVEFYQMLHSHGADEYAARVNSTYTDAPLSDPLSSYTPINPVHQVGNFRYDITQWNEPPFGKATHVDYVGFSSTAEPDWIDNDLYDGTHDYVYDKRTYGTHVNVENRALNGVTALYTNEVAGAMGWSVGSLDPNETVSLTIAFMFAQRQDSPDLVVTKTDDAQSPPGPEDELTYTLTWQSDGATDAENAELVDYLPAGVDYPAGRPTLDANFVVIPGDPNYDSGTHSYHWDLGTIPASGSGSVQLTVVVNNKAEPGMPMRNDAVLTTSIGDATGYWYTDIDCYGPDVIYVRQGAQGANIGTSWQDAYTDLRRALERAGEGCRSEIWVAQGTYDPGRLANAAFVLPANIALYGGFAGNETSRDQRNPNIHRTILTGGTDPERNETVVKMGQNSVLDGFVVTGSARSGQGIYASGVDCTIANTTAERNLGYGLRAVNGDVTLRWCTIRNNYLDGIRHDGEGSVLTMENSWLRQNARHGVYCVQSTPVIKNSIISESDMQEFGNEGIRMLNPTYPPVMQNVTLSHNKSAGIFFRDNATVGDPNGKDWPDLQNCIVYHNGGPQLVGFSADDTAWYSCIQDCNSVNYNISVDPEFAYFDPNNVRISFASPCKDAGSPLLDYEDQLDMDGRVRVLDEAVDIGAYEIDCEDTSNDLDWNADGRVDYGDFAGLASVWRAHDPNDQALYDPNLPCYECLHDPNSSAYVTAGQLELWQRTATKCNVSTTGCSEYAIDFADIVALIEGPEWLVWQACWLEEGEGSQMMFGGEGMLFVEAFEEQVTTEPPAYKQIGELGSIILKLGEIWLTDPAIQQEIDSAEWQGFMDALYDNLLDLYMSTQ